MILVLLLVSKFIHSIHGIDVCPPAPPFDPSCLVRLIIPGCSSDQDCTKPGTKCCRSECGVLQCIESMQGIIKVGICPPLPPVEPGFCLAARISSDCDGNDANCLGQKKCCPTICGSQNCRDPITEPRPECPAVPVTGPQCFRFDQQCSSDLDCPKSQICCGVICGTGCRDPAVQYTPPNPICPPYRKDVVCIRFDEQCKTNDDCREGDMCCPVECGTACKSPYRPPYKDCLLPVQTSPCRGAFKRYYYDVDTNTCTEFIYGGCQGNNNNFNSLQECEEKCSTNPTEPVCPPVCAIFCEFGNVLDSNGCPTCKCRVNPCPPVPPCPIQLVPPGECPRRCRFIYEVINGVNCKVRCELGPAGPIGPPCLPSNCIQGPTEPLPPPPTACEKGSPLANVRCGLGGQTCPNGYYCNNYVCCQIPCTNGSPHPTLTCGQFVGSNKCPPGYSCLAHPADAYFACCPDESSVTGNCPNGRPIPNIFCGRGPSRQDCPPGYSCNTDPADRFAVCCPDRIKYGSCPPVKPDTAGICVELCSGDDSCPGKEKCCSNGCGHVCTSPVVEHICALIRCPVSCEYGYELDNYGCQTCNCKPDSCPKPVCPLPPEGSCTEADYKIYNGVKCIWCPKLVECKPQPCPLPSCVPPPPLSCTEPDFRIFNGVKCPWCPKIVPCKPNCDAGMPLPDVNCGLRPDRQDCPAGFFCNVDPIDRFAVCCPECANGKPLQNVRCDDVNRKCPSGYQCKKIHGICCPSPCLPPPCPPPPQGACIEPQFTIIDGVKCPACYKIVPCKDKVCPAVPADSRCYEYTRECKDDYSCTDGRKCCRQGCSYVCVNPV